MPSRKSSAANPLQRGSACLCCRKRKLKCDGIRPVCSQCTKMNREDECEYDDKRQKSRTQKLKEKLSLLEQRLRELESESSATSPSSSDSSSGMPVTQNPSPNLAAVPFDYFDSRFGSPAIMPELDTDYLGNIDNLFDKQPSGSWSGGAGSSSSSLLAGSVYGTPEMGYEGDTEQSTHPFLEMSPFTSLPSTAEFPYMPQWNPDQPLPQESKRILLNIFLEHRHQCWFDGPVERLFLSNTNAQFSPSEPHPALMNAIYLVACQFARSPYCTEIQPVFFTRTLHEITVALDNSDRLVDIVQASCLLSVYLYMNCRALEGYCHSFSAARLAVGLGLHQIHPASYLSDDAPIQNTPIPIPPPRDAAEVADRIAAFWQVFMVDRCWSVANGLPVALPDGDCAQVRIKTPWPTLSMDYPPVPPTNSICAFFDNQPMLDLANETVYIPALRVQAAALYERTYRLASAGGSKKTDAYWADHQAAELTLQRFSMHLPAFIGFEAWRTQAPLIDVDLFAIHTMVHVSTLHLHKDIMGQECFHAASAVLALIRQLNDGDYEYLDPILSSCWSTVARTYMRMLDIAVQQQGEAATINTASMIEQEIDVILNTMRTFSAFSPLSGDHAKKIEHERAQAQSPDII